MKKNFLLLIRGSIGLGILIATVFGIPGSQAQTPPTEGRSHEFITPQAELESSSVGASSGSIQALSEVTRFTPNYNFPRLATIGVMGSNGTGLDTEAEYQLAARFNYLHVIAEPILFKYRDRAARLREINPGLTLVGYWPTGFMWENSYAEGYLFGDLLRKVKLPYPDDPTKDWLVYDQQDPPQPYVIYGNYTYDFTKQDFVNWYVDFIATKIYGAGVYDGIYFDAFCDTISWTEAFAGGQKINYQKAGFSSLAEFDTAHAAGMQSFSSQLRQRVGDQWLMIGNCGRIKHDPQLNGASLEKWPYLNTSITFTRWSDNMLTYVGGGGYLVQDRQKRFPQYNWLLPYLVPYDSTDFYNPTAQQLVRFGLASSLLGSGYFGPMQIVNGNGGPNTIEAWYDEYDNGGQGTGYLGQPTGTAYQMIDRTRLTGTELWVNGSAETDTSGWTLGANPPASWSRDTTEAKVGTASVHATIPQALTFDWQVQARQQMNISLGNVYSTTFWIKANQPRTVHVTVSLNDTSTIAIQELPIDQTWREFQVPFFASASGFVKVHFSLGHQAGDVWLDDVTVKKGMTHLWRRDFEHGSAFVNPCTFGFIGCPTQTFGLSANMQRILGTQNPTLNNGQTVSSVSVAPEDGIILLSTTNPPASSVQCTENWSCTAWSACSGGTQARACTDANACRTTSNKPTEARACDDVPPAAVSDLRAL